MQEMHHEINDDKELGFQGHVYEILATEIVHEYLQEVHKEVPNETTVHNETNDDKVRVVQVQDEEAVTIERGFSKEHEQPYWTMAYTKDEDF